MSSTTEELKQRRARQKHDLASLRKELEQEVEYYRVNQLLCRQLPRVLENDEYAKLALAEAAESNPIALEHSLNTIKGLSNYIRTNLYEAMGHEPPQTDHICNADPVEHARWLMKQYEDVCRENYEREWWSVNNYNEDHQCRQDSVMRLQSREANIEASISEAEPGSGAYEVAVASTGEINQHSSAIADFHEHEHDYEESGMLDLLRDLLRCLW